MLEYPLQIFITGVKLADKPIYNDTHKHLTDSAHLDFKSKTMVAAHCQQPLLSNMRPSLKMPEQKYLTDKFTTWPARHRSIKQSLWNFQLYSTLISKTKMDLAVCSMLHLM